MSTFSINEDVQRRVKHWRNSLRLSSACRCYSNRQTSEIGRRTTASIINIKFASTHANDSITRKTDREYLSLSLCWFLTEERGERGERSAEIECCRWQTIRSINGNWNRGVYPWDGKHHWWKRMNDVQQSNWDLSKRKREKEQVPWKKCFSHCISSHSRLIDEWWLLFLFNYRLPRASQFFFSRIFTCRPSLFRCEKRQID